MLTFKTKPTITPRKAQILCAEPQSNNIQSLHCEDAQKDSLGGDAWTLETHSQEPSNSTRNVHMHAGQNHLRIVTNPALSQLSSDPQTQVTRTF